MPVSRHRRNGRTRPRVPHTQAKDPRCPVCMDDYDYDADWRHTLECIEREGWYAQGVLGDRTHPEYVYTVGLSRIGHPELVIVGMSCSAGYTELAGLVPAVLGGISVVGIGEVPKPCGCVVRLVPVEPGAIDLGVADIVHGGPVRALQYVWSAGGVYPGESGYDEIAYRQPLLGDAWWLA